MPRKYYIPPETTNYYWSQVVLIYNFKERVEYYKTINLIDNKNDQPFKFKTKNLMVGSNDANRNYNYCKEIKF